MAVIVVIGLGPGSPQNMTEQARRCLVKGQPLYLRTACHPVSRWLNNRGINYHSFDRYYRRGSSFNRVYRAILGKLLREARCHRAVYYAVPGHPLAGEAVVGNLLRHPRPGLSVRVVPGLSFLEPLLTTLHLDLLRGVTVLDALRLEKLCEPVPWSLVITQVYSRAVASRVKLKLLELYPSSTPVAIVRQAGLAGGNVRRLPLYRLDRGPWFDHYTSLFLPAARQRTLGCLARIVERLRAPEGCPWDRRQDHRSLRPYLLEEAYEVIAAIDSGKGEALCEELGDLLLQVVLHSQIAHEGGAFDLFTVIENIIAKLIRRHPHVFGQERIATADGVRRRWQQIKGKEKGKQGSLVQVEKGLPALLQARKVQENAAAVGFDWPDPSGAVLKLKEELAELEDAYRMGDQARIEEELGDFLFATVNVSRFFKVDAELALGRAVLKFIHRFRYIEAQVARSGRDFADFTLEELDRWWEKVKNKGNSSQRGRSLGKDSEFTT